MSNQDIYITQSNTNQGCFGGCGTAFAVVLLVGVAVQYWYVSLAIAVIGGGLGLWYYRTQQPIGRPQPQAIEPSRAGLVARSCDNCGNDVAGNFCAHCGAAQGRTCVHCGNSGLSSPYCPDCGAATFTPPAPT